MAEKKEKKIIEKIDKTPLKAVKKIIKAKVAVKKAVKKPVKVAKKKVVIEKTVKQDKVIKGEYFEAVGRRKTAVARVRLYIKGDKEIIVNNKIFKEYFPTFELQEIVKSPLITMEFEDKFRITVILKGGGVSSQAEALRHGITRAIEIYDPESRQKLKQAGFLTRDSRMRERKKPGLKRARKAPQWSKR